MHNSEFLWGASTSGFQVEGAYNEDGKGLSTTDVRNVPDNIADNSYSSDHYHRYKEDIALMRELGLKAYRFSLCWARVMPDGHNVNEKGLEFYENVIDECIKLDIEPIPTLYHFEMPQALVEEFGGWKSRKCIDAFEKYAEVCFKRFKGKINKWITINEQLIAMAASDLNGNHESDEDLKLKYMYQMSYNASVAEKRAFKLINEIDPSCKIGPVNAIQIVYPSSSNPNDVLAAMDAEEMMMYMFLDMSVFGDYSMRVKNYLESKGYSPVREEEDEELLNSYKPDFIGINYYSSICVKENANKEILKKLPPFFKSELFKVVPNENIERTEWMANGIDPLGIRTGIYKIYNRYHLPMIVTENGMAYSDEVVDGKINDDYRIDYLSKHIKEVLKAREEGYPVFGYCPWSFIDLVSSHQGFSKRYGLVYVNRTDTDIKDCKRIKKDSFYWYQNVIKSNGEELC